MVISEAQRNTKTMGTYSTPRNSLAAVLHGDVEASTGRGTLAVTDQSESIIKH